MFCSLKGYIDHATYGPVNLLTLDIANISDCNVAGNRLPPIPHTEVPPWQKPITNFFNTGGSKNSNKHSDPDKKMQQDTRTSKIPQKSYEKGEPAQMGDSSCNADIETDHQEKRSQVNNKLDKNEEGDPSINENASDNKSETDNLKEVSPKSPPASPPETVNCKENEPVNERNIEAVISTNKHEVNEPQPSMEDSAIVSEEKQNKVLTDSNKSVGITDGSHHKDNCDEKNKLATITKVLEDKENNSISPGGGNFHEKNNSCQKGAESGDEEKEHAHAAYDGEPPAKKIKT
nr:unnamed protein product [Callosobruchus analis]